MREGAAIIQDDQIQLRRYLLGQLTEADGNEVELRLLTDANYSREYGIVENELIDEYVEGSLKAEERTKFELYFLKAPERRDKLEFATALGQAVRARSSMLTASAQKPPTVPWYSFSHVYLKAAAVVVVVLGVGLIVWVLLSRKSGEEQGMADLRAAYKNERLIKARVTKLDYAPLVIKRGQDKPDIDEVSLRRAELQLLKDLDEHPGPKARHALGRFYLAGRQFDKAIEHLGIALEQEPNNAQINSDMGAVLLEIGQQAGQDKESGKAFAFLARSLEHINKALQIDPDLLEALYNKALCLQSMKAPEQAKEAWQNYLAHDTQSKWAEEARRNLQSLSALGASPLTAAQLLESFLAAYRARDDARAWALVSRNKEMITGKMISPQLEREYISLTQSRNEDGAQQSLRAFLYAGGLETERSGDPYTSELAQYYAASSAAQLRLLAEAIEDLNEGYRLCLGADYSAALDRFVSARSLFTSAGNTWSSKLTDYWIAYCYTQTDRVKESTALLKSLATFCESRNFKWLLSQAYEWIAVNHSILSEHSEAIKYHQMALALSEAISDTYLMQKALTELGDEYAELRQPSASLAHFYRGLSLALESNAGLRQSSRNFSYTAAALFAFKYYDAAAAFANEALALGAKELNDPTLSYLMYIYLGRIYGKLQRFNEATQQANLGLQIAQSIQDKTASQKLTANALLHLAHIQREQGSCDQAIRSYDNAINIYEQMEFDLYKYSAYKGRLLCSLDIKDLAGVERDLPTLIGLYERQRTFIREEQNRNSFFDTEQDAYDIAIEYEHSRHNDMRAIEYAEESRARSLLDAMQTRGRVVETAAGPDVVFSQVSNTLDLEMLRRNLPPQVQVVVYAVLPTKLLVWSISRDGLATFEENIPAEILEADVRQYVDALQERRTEEHEYPRQLGMKLYQVLLGKVIKQIAREQKICIIPDKFLHGLSFAALISPETGKFFVEDWAIFYTSSLNVLWRCSEIARKKGGARAELVLSIGNPTFDRHSYPQLLPLQAAEREAREVAGLYGNSAPLIGPQATKKSVLSAMVSAEIIHFAGHYVIDESTPLSSKMLLAAGDSPDASDSVLPAAEILRHRFDNTKLIVLSACQTGSERYYRGEGAIGLSRTFIAVGVPLIVASQWPIESDATANLMIDFQGIRRSGVATADALRNAQIKMLSGPDKARQLPYYWASFVCVGGYTNY
jgi:CHAT domain-containing protein